MHVEENVRQRAFEILEEAGRPEGHHDQHWRQALSELSSGGVEQSQNVEQGGDSDIEDDRRSSINSTLGRLGGAAAVLRKTNKPAKSRRKVAVSSGDEASEDPLEISSAQSPEGETISTPS